MHISIGYRHHHFRGNVRKYSRYRSRQCDERRGEGAKVSVSGGCKSSSKLRETATRVKHDSSETIMFRDERLLIMRENKWIANMTTVKKQAFVDVYCTTSTTISTTTFSEMKLRGEDAELECGEIERSFDFSVKWEKGRSPCQVPEDHMRILLLFIGESKTSSYRNLHGYSSGQKTCRTDSGKPLCLRECKRVHWVL